MNGEITSLKERTLPGDMLARSGPKSVPAKGRGEPKGRGKIKGPTPFEQKVNKFTEVVFAFDT